MELPVPNSAQSTPPVIDYARPAGLAGPQVWRERSLVVVADDADLPARCVLCNAPATIMRRRSYAWFSPLMLIPLGLGVFLPNGWPSMLIIFPLLIAFIVFGRRVRSRFGLCERHYRKQLRLRRIEAIAFVLAIAATIGAAAAVRYGWQWTEINGGQAYLLLVVLGFWLWAWQAHDLRTSLLPVVQIHRDRVWLSGACPEFLASLSEKPKKIE